VKNLNDMLDVNKVRQPLPDHIIEPMSVDVIVARVHKINRHLAVAKICKVCSVAGIGCFTHLSVRVAIALRPPLAAAEIVL
jgi:hypothetical protein